jgi:hypothetical protein
LYQFFNFIQSIITFFNFNNLTYIYIRHNFQKSSIYKIETEFIM